MKTLLAKIMANPEKALKIFGMIIAVIIAAIIVLMPLPHSDRPNSASPSFQFAQDTLSWVWTIVWPLALKAAVIVGIYKMATSYFADAGRAKRKQEREAQQATRLKAAQDKGNGAIDQLIKAEPVLKAFLDAGNVGRNDVQFDEDGCIVIRIVQEKVK